LTKEKKNGLINIFSKERRRCIWPIIGPQKVNYYRKNKKI